MMASSHFLGENGGLEGMLQWMMVNDGFKILLVIVEDAFVICSLW